MYFLTWACIKAKTKPKPNLSQKIIPPPPPLLSRPSSRPSTPPSPSSRRRRGGTGPRPEERCKLNVKQQLVSHKKEKEKMKYLKNLRTNVPSRLLPFGYLKTARPWIRPSTNLKRFKILIICVKFMDNRVFFLTCPSRTFPLEYLMTPRPSSAPSE